jgi:hypothetical protein
LNGLHLLNRSKNGVEIQFYVLLTLVVWTLQTKQERLAQAAAVEAAGLRGEGKKTEEKGALGTPSAGEWIKKAAQIFLRDGKSRKNGSW